MNCRYCNGLYAVSERTCGGCGAPKTFVQTLLDVPAAPNHWSQSMMRTAQLVALISLGIAIVFWVIFLMGFENLATLMAFVWIVPLSAIALAMGAWQSSIGNFQLRIRNIVIAVLLWAGLGIALFLVIGAAAS